MYEHRRALLSVVGFLFLLLAWEAVGRFGLLGATFAPPSAVVSYLSASRNVTLLLRGAVLIKSTVS
jgi:hypothetical protein